QIPLIVAWLVAIVLSIVYWKRHPAVSLLTMVAMLFFIVASLVASTLTGVVPFMLGIAARTSLLLVSIGRVITVIIQTCGWIMLIIALFGWRRKPDAPTR
ncbi:MAG TPA: hypothetical protein VGK87_05305, partial [Anaerolineae bacterium]